MRPPRPPPQPAPARIWGFVASEAPRIVLLRRGPSKWTQMWLWNTETDEFEAGSWFAGHIYYLACDLSPDGEYFLYSAYNPSKYRRAEVKEKFGVEQLDDWTSLCIPPAFTSVALWTPEFPSGGGHFRSLNHLALFSNQQELLAPPKKLSVTQDAFSNPFQIGLHRTGWRGLPLLNWNKGDLSKGRLKLKWQAKYGFQVSKVHTYTYSHPAADLSGVSWADLDQQGRLVYARQGCVYRHTDAGEELLADLNASQPPRPWLNAKPQDNEKTAPKGGLL